MLTMESIYSCAKAIVSRAQPSLDGGIITFTLNNIIKIPTADVVNDNVTSHSDVTIIDHILSTYSRTGYVLGIVCAILWSIILIIIGCCTCRRRKHFKKDSETLIYLAPIQDNHILNTSRENVEIHSVRRTSAKSTFQRTRERLQSNWICLAIQFGLLTILTILLGTGVILGFTVSSQFHTNLVTTSIHEESIEHLLTVKELEKNNSQKGHIIPQILYGLAQVKAYANEFVPQTKIDIQPVVKELIMSTEVMQNRMTNEFNTIFFNDIGITEAFQLGDILGEHVVTLMTKYLSIVQLNNAFKYTFDVFKVEFQSWLRLINIDSMQNDYNCIGECSILRSTFINNISIRSDSFMPEINFAIALKFLTTDRNQTPESVQAQLNHGKELSNSQLDKTKALMAKYINVPESIENMTEQQWDNMTPQLNKVITKIDNIFMIINRLIIPKIVISSNLFLTLNLFYWFSILLITIGLIWLIIRYHFIPIEMKVNTRNRVYLGLTISLFILALSIILACFFYLIGGYLYTEGCRYINPEENIIHNNTHYDNSEKTIFPIDKYINDFINHNWLAIVSLFKKFSHMPIPHIRSPIYGILYNCRKNQGILEAFDSIKDFDMKALNDPEMLKRFSHVGKQIMIDSLRSINVDEIFPKQTDDNLAMASRLDDFIVNYNDVRLKLPKYYLTIQQSSLDQSGNYIPWSINDMWNVWDAYYSDILSYHLSVEQMNRLNTATEKVRTILTQLDNIISQIDSNLTVLSGLKKIGPHVAKLQNKLITLKNIMNNKTYLIDRAIELFDQHIQRKTPEEADKLIMKYGPKIMSKVGQCHRLYDAAVNINNAICDQFVSVLNGFWFLIGWITLIGTLMILFSLILLMHKPPMTEKSYHKKVTRTKIKSNKTTVTENPNELEAMNNSQQPVDKSF